MTAGDRLRALAGAAGTAGALLLLIGAGATSGAALVDYSGLSTGTAGEHLLVDARQASFSQEIDITLVDKKSRKPQHVAIDDLAEQIQVIEAKKDVLIAEKKQAVRKQKNAKIRSSEFYELQAYTYLLTLEITQQEGYLRDLQAHVESLQSINDRLEWQQSLAYELQQQQAFEMQAMHEMDMAFVITMLAEA